MHPSAIENVNTMFPHFQRGVRGTHAAAVKDREGLGTGSLFSTMTEPFQSFTFIIIFPLKMSLGEKKKKNWDQDGLDFLKITNKPKTH